MFILQVLPTSLVHKMGAKTPLQSKLFIESILFFIFMVEETIILTEIWKNQVALMTFLKGQDARHGSSECTLVLNFNAPLVYAPKEIEKIKQNKNFPAFLFDLTACCTFPYFFLTKGPVTELINQ